MCGAFTLHHKAASVVARFHTPQLGEPILPRYKVLPSEDVEIVRLDRSGARLLDNVRWGLVPFWAKEPAIGRKMINARSEELGEKPAFRQALLRRRCLIPADGFYEWDRETRQPMFFRRADGELFAFAGLWEEWRDREEDGPPLRTCTIITTAANDVVGKVHDRMPVILTPDSEALWIGDEAFETQEGVTAQALRSVLRPFPDSLMEGYWVSKRLNARGEHGPEAIEPVNPEEERRAPLDVAETLALPL